MPFGTQLLLLAYSVAVTVLLVVRFAKRRIAWRHRLYLLFYELWVDTADDKRRYYEYLRSSRWDSLKKHRLSWDHHRCRLCNTDDQLSVHHRWYPDEFGQETVDDLTTLCRTCHHQYHAFC